MSGVTEPSNPSLNSYRGRFVVGKLLASIWDVRGFPLMPNGLLAPPAPCRNCAVPAPTVPALAFTPTVPRLNAGPVPFAVPPTTVWDTPVRFNPLPEP